jgi:hypothetical protein
MRDRRVIRDKRTTDDGRQQELGVVDHGDFAAPRALLGAGCHRKALPGREVLDMYVDDRE